MSTYSLATLRVTHAATAYGTFHEYAHQDQNARKTFLWRLWWRVNHVPRLGYWCRLLVEAEAALLALWELRQLGVLESGDVREAWLGFLSYVLQRECA